MYKKIPENIKALRKSERRLKGKLNQVKRSILDLYDNLGIDWTIENTKENEWAKVRLPDKSLMLPDGSIVLKNHERYVICKITIMPDEKTSEYYDKYFGKKEEK